MENKPKIDLSIVDAFKRENFDVDIKPPKWAERKPAAELKAQGVGDISLFPVSEYQPSTIRSTPSASLFDLQVNEGRVWRTKQDRPNKAIAVIRLK